MRPVALVLALMFTAGMAATAGETPTGDVKQVRAQGCIEPGVEAGCLVVKDIESGKLYNILVKGLRPGVGEGIEFTGAAHEGPTTCMQGIAVDVIKWTRKTSLKCSPNGTVKE
jgi:hypothetical protein